MLNGGCQSLLQSTRMGSHPLLMVDVKACYSQHDECQSLLKSTSMGSHPLLMVDVKSTTVNENSFYFC